MIQHILIGLLGGCSAMAGWTAADHLLDWIRRLPPPGGGTPMTT